MTTPLLYAEGKPVSDDQAFQDAILLSLERTMRQARFLQQRYLLLVEPMSKVLYENFPEPPEWSAGFCFTADGTLPYDGERYVICLLNAGHRGECGGRDLVRHVDRKAAKSPTSYFFQRFDTPALQAAWPSSGAHGPGPTGYEA